MKFRVLAECTEYFYIEVEADSRDEALEKAEEIDGGDYNYDCCGQWYITDATPITK